MAPRIRVGIIGWNYPEWRGLVYAPRAKPSDFLAQYAARFPLVEAASSSYGMPRTAVVERWARETPDDFEMSLKVPGWILQKPPREPDLPRALGVLLDHLAPLRDAGKLGALVAQFHPGYTREKHAEDLAAFVEALPAGPRWAVELRHPSWWTEETYRLLDRAGVTLVWSALADGFRTPPVATTGSLYLRLFGDRSLEPPYAEVRRDATEELEHWVERIGVAAATVDRVDVLASKYLEGHAPATAAKLEAMLGLAPPAPPRALGPPKGQSTLPLA